jgi:hypothetical protein
MEREDGFEMNSRKHWPNLICFYFRRELAYSSYLFLLSPDINFRSVKNTNYWNGTLRFE